MWTVQPVSEKLSSNLVRFHKYRCNSVCWTYTISSPFSLKHNICKCVNWSQIKGMRSPARTARQGLVALRLLLSSTLQFPFMIISGQRELNILKYDKLFGLFSYEWVYLMSFVNSCGRFRSYIRCMQINTVEWYWSTEIKTKQLSASKQCCLRALVMLGASPWQW